MSKGFMCGNISLSVASLSARDSSSSPLSYSTRRPASPSSPMPKESTDWHALVKSVSSDLDVASPCHDCARSVDSCGLVSRTRLLLPDGSKAVFSSASTLSLRTSRVARSSLVEALSDKS